MNTNTDQIIKTLNFWQETVKSASLRPREILEDLDYKSKEIIDLIGVRRSGKSSILKLIISRLNLDNFLFVNFEDPFFIANNGPEIIEELIGTYQSYFNPNLKYVFFDEIQEINCWERAVRKLRDGGKFKIFITGSSAKLLNREASTLLTGRHLSYRIMPLSFKEFLLFQKINIAGRKDLVLRDLSLKKIFKTYLEIGGFPEVALTKNKELLKNYFSDILQKDIITRHNIRDKEALEKIAVYLFSNAGKFVPIETLKKLFQCRSRPRLPT